MLILTEEISILSPRRRDIQSPSLQRRDICPHDLRVDIHSHLSQTGWSAYYFSSRRDIHSCDIRVNIRSRFTETRYPPLQYWRQDSQSRVTSGGVSMLTRQDSQSDTVSGNIFMIIASERTFTLDILETGCLVSDSMRQTVFTHRADIEPQVASGRISMLRKSERISVLEILQVE